MMVYRDTVVYFAAQEASMPHHEYTDRKKENMILSFEMSYLIKSAHQVGDPTYLIWKKLLLPIPRY